MKQLMVYLYIFSCNSYSKLLTRRLKQPLLRACSTDSLINHSQTAFTDYINNNRRWDVVERYWAKIVQAPLNQLPSFILGYSDGSPYGIAKLDEVESVGFESEFLSRDPRFTSRATYAIRIGNQS